MGKKSGFFRAFVAGNTVSDGRKITPEMIDDVVSTFHPETYSPRINVEHISGYSPQPPFNGYGTVAAVRAQDDDIVVDGKTEKRRCLYAQVDGNDQLVRLAAIDQKPFPSLELTDNYAGTGKFGLVGLAFTDNPASLGTQRLQFSRSAPGTVFGAGPDAVALAFEAEQADPAGLADKIGAAIAGAFSRLGFKPAEPEKQVQTPPVVPPAPANDNAALFTAMGEAMSAGIAAAVAPINTRLGQLATDFGTMRGQLEKTELPGFSRKPAAGGGADAVHLTDC